MSFHWVEIEIEGETKRIRVVGENAMRLVKELEALSESKTASVKGSSGSTPIPQTPVDLVPVDPSPVRPLREQLWDVLEQRTGLSFSPRLRAWLLLAFCFVAGVAVASHPQLGVAALAGPWFWEESSGSENELGNSATDTKSLSDASVSKASAIDDPAEPGEPANNRASNSEPSKKAPDLAANTRAGVSISIHASYVTTRGMMKWLTPPGTPGRLKGFPGRLEVTDSELVFTPYGTHQQDKQMKIPRSAARCNFKDWNSHHPKLKVAFWGMTRTFALANDPTKLSKLREELQRVDFPSS